MVGRCSKLLLHMNSDWSAVWSAWRIGTVDERSDSRPWWRSVHVES